MSLLKPEELNQLKNLLLVAKTVVDSLYLGIHPGKNRGVGTEFQQYRTYQPGDDIRRIDWKMFARSDRYYIRESQIESSIIIRFVLDSSASMQVEQNGLSKWNWAKMIAATMGYLAFQQGDSIGLWTINSEEINTLEPRRDKLHLNQFIYQLEHTESKGEWPEWNTLRKYLESSNQKELWVLISDCFSENDAWFNSMQKLSGLGKDISVIQILADYELNLPEKMVAELIQPETLQRKAIASESVKKEYQQAFDSYQNQLKSLQSEYVDFSTWTLSEPIHQVIEQFIKHRARF